jgi:YegS/Rv2252/BmrU family lipid kinase
MRRAALIYNPASGRRRHGRVLDAILSTLRRGGFAVEPAPTSFAGQATELARELARAGRVEVVFAFGGDGTAREVAAGLLGSPVALGFLPGGTANVLTLAFGLPRDPVAAAAVLARLPPRPIDVGLAGGSPFLMMVSAGLDASLLAALDQELKGRFGQAAIVCQGAWEWWRYPYPQLQIVADGERLEPASFAAASNIPFYGGSFRLAPEARLDSGRLELVLFRGKGRTETFWFTMDLLRAAHLRRKDVVVRPVEEVVFEGPAGTVAQVDGDLCQERLPVTVRLAPERLFVLAPAAP